MLDLDLGESLTLLRETVHRFSAEEIKPRAASIDRDNEFPMDLWRKMGDLGLLGITVGEGYGGSDMGYLAQVIAIEEISRASASVGLSYGAHSNLCVNQLQLNATRCGGGSFTSLRLNAPAAYLGSLGDTLVTIVDFDRHPISEVFADVAAWTCGSHTALGSAASAFAAVTAWW